ncbi:MAG: DUF2851 family protein [Flavobacteriales bacterium]|nr:DUF2851 family protein [Flavobacteriales bacterium]
MPYPKEELLHHIWQHRLFHQQGLKTSDGQNLQIIRVGELNKDAGPDFRNVRIKVDGTEWAGNVEIHVRSSDWLRHDHQHDSSYSNIILHVVFEDDLNESLGAFPTLELKELISDQVLRRYEKLSASVDALPCGKQFMEVSELVRMAWFDSLLIGRLQRKSEWMDSLVEEFNGDLEQAFMVVLFRSFGMKVNADPFEQLARNTSWKVLSKHQDDLFQLEAILFGNAGFLNHPKDDYQQHLRQEYDFLQHKYGLQPLNNKLWKFLRLRPANFPTVRIAQLAALFQKTGAFFRWFSNHNEQIDPRTICVSPSNYWETRYNFGKESAAKSKRIGTVMAQNILINAVAPFLFVSAHREAKPELQDKALAILQQLPAEKNVKVNVFADQGLEVKSAAESQALIELKSNFCDHKKCLFCSIGVNILKTGS